MTRSTWQDRLLNTACAAAILIGLVSCATLNQLSVEVATFGAWPTQRAAGTFAFDRLPSQQAQAGEPGDAQSLIEKAAAAALENAGFRPVAVGSEPDLLVQVGARVSRLARSPWDDPLWWPGGFAQWRHGSWGGPWGGPWGARPWGPVWGTRSLLEPVRYEREVALLLRDRASGRPLYEARASSDGLSASMPALLPAMFAAAMTDFPATGVNPRQVTVPLSP